ncbi:hypothetical protein [Actinomadura gamaensis]|uniref:Uncharacterized protein n=1 Tax=Actinomadura gamaensis TaxID=1763541 RepID=A0ABV9TWQ2_9ACTN
MSFRNDLLVVCGFVAGEAARYGVIGNRAAMLVIAAGEVAGRLIESHPVRSGGLASVHVWARNGALHCRFEGPSGWCASEAPKSRLRDHVQVTADGPTVTLTLPPASST